MKTIQDEILLVIPYIKSTQGNELELALTGWRRYCTSPLRIIVIGEYDPSIEGKAEFIEVPRIEKVQAQYTPNIDVARKLDKIYEMFHTEYDHFVLANDDEYPIHEFDWKFLTQVTYLQASFMGNLAAPTNYWTHDMGKTRKALDKEGKPHVNYCNHHPFYFDMERFHDVSVKFNLANDSMIRENLYYNYYEFKTSKNVNDIRTGFWDTKNTKETFRKAVGNKNIKFICNSVAGYSKELMELIEKYYEKDISVKYEKPIVYDTSVIDKIDLDEMLPCKNKIHVLIPNLNQLSYTQNIVNCLLIQDSDFDLTIFDQHSQEKFTDRYYDDLKRLWPRKNCQLNIVKNSVNAPLNHVWNWFYKHTINPYIALLNNDIEICDNFISNAEKIFEKEPKCGIISHPTNIKEYTKKNELEYDIIKSLPYLQGWDMIINRNAYKEIPDDLFIYAGDEYIYDQMVLENKYKQVYDISSPVLHYVSKTIMSNRKEVEKILNNDLRIYRQKYKRYAIFKDHKYCHRKFNGVFPIDLTKKIIVSFTTWEKRIDNVKHVIDIMNNQTRKPDKVILNLSKEEFKGKMNLVNEVLELENTNDIFEVNWVEGANTKVWKKFIPIIDKYPNDLVITIDDDLEYPKDFIETLWNSYLNNPYSPVSGIDKVWYGIHHCCGSCNMLQYKFIKLYLNTWKDVYNNIQSSDTYYVYIHKLNGYDFKTSNKVYYKQLKEYNPIEGYSKSNMKSDPNWTINAYKYLINKYGNINGFTSKK